MKILVYGLGIIGASIAASLKRAGYAVYGKNRSNGPLEYALLHGMIDGVRENYDGMDVVFLALPPNVAMRELEGGNFPEGCIVADICGVKECIEKAVLKAPRNYRYVGAHPMAGKETTGIVSASATLFRGANLVLTQNEQTDAGALEVLRALAEDMGFSRVVVCSASEHDKMIALTSQLAHIVSSAYIKTPRASSCVGYTGGSFQDMTRVGVMDDVWADLFLLNREALLPEMDRLLDGLREYRRAIAEGDKERLLAAIRAGKTFHDEFFRQNRG